MGEKAYFLFDGGLVGKEVVNINFSWSGRKRSFGGGLRFAYFADHAQRMKTIDFNTFMFRLTGKGMLFLNNLCLFRFF